MKLIFKIAKNELRQLFYSSTAWFVAGVFMFMCAFFYIGIIYPAAKMFFEYRSILSSTQIAIFQVLNTSSSVTQALFGNKDLGFLFSFLPYVYLFFPLLTMGVINKEFTIGTSNLLRSSPITSQQIVLGKFLAYSVFNLLLVLIIGIFIFFGAFHIKWIDINMLLAALAGFFLLFSTYTAIGFFASSLTRYQIAAAIGAFVILGILNNISNVWQEHQLMRELSWFLSLQDRVQFFLRGLIRSKDIFYYLIIITVFLGSTWIRLNAEQKKKPWYFRLSQYVGLIIAGIVVGYIFSLPRFVKYLDTTSGKLLSIEPQVQYAIQQLNKAPLEITVYANLFDPDGLSAVTPSKHKELLNQFESLLRYKWNVKANYVYYYHFRSPTDSLEKQKVYPGKSARQIAELLAPFFKMNISDFLTPEEIDSRVDAASENYVAFSHAKYQDEVTPLRALPLSPLQYSIRTDDASQPHFVAAFHRLTRQAMPRITFVSGHLERNIYKRGEREFMTPVNEKLSNGSLMNIGFNIDTVNLASQQIDSGTAVLVVADPKIPLDSVAMGKLNKYLEQGRNMFIMGEPGKQSVLNPLLQNLGIIIREGQIVEPQANQTPDHISTKITLNDTILAPEPWFNGMKILLNHKLPHEGNMDAGTILGSSALGRSPSTGAYKVIPLLTTLDGRTWIQANKLVSDSSLPNFNLAKGDVKENSFVLNFALTRMVNGKEQRIVVCGDADFASNSSEIHPAYPKSIYSWLSYNQYPMYNEIFQTIDHDMHVRSLSWINTEKIICLYVLPGFFLILGTTVLIRRSRK